MLGCATSLAASTGGAVVRETCDGVSHALPVVLFTDLLEGRRATAVATCRCIMGMFNNTGAELAAEGHDESVVAEEELAVVASF